MIYAVIMAGGKGERFWPASRKKTPKQLLNFFGEKTLLGLTVDRVSELIPDENIIIVTNTEQENKVREVVPHIPAKNIIAEPIGRNTAPCIGLAARFIGNLDPNAVMIVLPADHIISRKKDFIKNITDAAKIAEETDNLITFGIRPSGPETGYGYIKVDKRVKFDCKTIFSSVKGFFEKPDEKTAQEYLKSGDFLWNSGMFVWRCDVVWDAINKYIPKTGDRLSALDISFDKPVDIGELKKAYESIEGISIDYGVMEKVKNVLVVSSDFIWDDVGSWSAFDRHGKKDKNGNIVSADIVNLDTENCIISGEDKLIATLGLKDLVIVDTDDALLICKKDRAQDVKKIVAQLKKDRKYFKYL